LAPRDGEVALPALAQRHDPRRFRMATDVLSQRILRRGVGTGRIDPTFPLAAVAGCGIGALAALAAAPAAPQAVGFAALVIPLVALMSALGNVRRVLLGLLLLDIPFQLDENISYRDDLAELNALGGWNISLTTLCLAALYALWAAELAASRRGAPRPRLGTAVAPVAFVLCVAASTAGAHDRIVAGFELSLLVQMLLLFVYVASTVRTPGDVRFVAAMLLVGLALESLLAMALYTSGGEFRIGGIVSHSRFGDEGGGTTRVGGTIGSPNEAGSYFAVMTALAVAVFTRPVDRGLRRLALVSSMLGVVALALTLSRGGWVGFIVAIAVVLAGSRAQRRGRSSLLSMAVVVTALICILVPLYPTISSRISGDDSGAAASRLPLMEIAAEMIEDHPILGVGANNFAVVLPDYAGPRFSETFLSVVHNKYLVVWSEAGVGALIAFLLFVGSAIRRGWRGRTDADPLLSAISLGLAAGVAGLAVHMNFDIFKGRPMTQTLWLIAALLASAAFHPTGHRAGSWRWGRARRQLGQRA
jgi:putative inorganic carbon (HCO3(-)) transporter